MKRLYGDFGEIRAQESTQETEYKGESTQESTQETADKEESTQENECVIGV